MSKKEYPLLIHLTQEQQDLLITIQETYYKKFGFKLTKTQITRGAVHKYLNDLLTALKDEGEKK